MNTNYKMIFETHVKNQEYELADKLLDDLIKNQGIKFLVRSDALSLLYRLGYVYPERVLDELIPQRDDIPMPFIDCLKMTLDRKSSNKIYRGKDGLVSVKMALKQGRNIYAKMLLFMLYNHFNISPIPLVQNSRLKLGCNSVKLKKCRIVDSISTIVTTYNSVSFIENCIQGLSNQTILNHEIIVVDDASTDETSDVIRNRFPWVKLIVLDENQGTYNARNIGVSHASGDFITFQDSDDWSHPQRLERQLKDLLSNPICIANYSSFFRVDIDTGLPSARQLYPLIRLNLSSLLMRKDNFFRMGQFDASYRVEADRRFYENLRSQNKIINILKEPLAVGSYRKNSLTTGPGFGFNAYGFSRFRCFS